MAKIFDIITGERKGVSQNEFMDLLSTAELYIERIRPYRKNQAHLNHALDIIAEMKWNAAFSQKFRDELAAPMEEFLDDLFIEIQQNSACGS
jgi:hypothetical protein